ncbi:NfeD family protein [Fulvivirgaceae bacterium BMA10]|uniref:NfeD family protein n=2 Tax=Splendidivirga corallicola TaxID=3051826 RepID=A0ABT8KMZ6_9BACT|nr:NfeD family protein [Fulvivirgaceae bacterium BMA10]
MAFFSRSITLAQTPESDTVDKVLLMHIQQTIDPRINRYVNLGLKEADNEEVDYIVIEMDTYGGALTDADDIRTMLLNYEKPIFVFINKDAASAGALISIACDSIYMAPGSSIGAATVVTQDGQAAPDKYQSYMRSIMRSTAEAKGRDPQIAEAMVDENLEVPGISEEGQVITFSTSEAIEHGFCEAEVNSIEDVLDLNNIKNYEIIEFKLGATEKIISFFLNPFISGILILIIIGGIYFELQTPGVGFPLIASIVAMALYFTPYYLNGLAENWEIAIFFVGIALIILEIFVIPGFGVAGISGIICTVGSLVLAMLNNDIFDFSFVRPGEIFLALTTTLAGFSGAFIVMFIGGVKLTQTRAFKRIALQDTQDSSEGFTSNFKEEAFTGKTGIAYTVLRPSGKIMIGEEIYDAYTRGNYINKGEKVIVISDEGTSLKVKKA